MFLGNDYVSKNSYNSPHWPTELIFKKNFHIQKS